MALSTKLLYGIMKMKNRLSYSKLLQEISKFKNCGKVYSWVSGRSELVESPSSGKEFHFRGNIMGFEIGTRHDIKNTKMPRKKKKKLLAMLKRRVRNCSKEIERMDFTDETLRNA